MTLSIEEDRASPAPSLFCYHLFFVFPLFPVFSSLFRWLFFLSSISADFDQANAYIVRLLQWFFISLGLGLVKIFFAICWANLLTRGVYIRWRKRYNGQRTWGCPPVQARLLGTLHCNNRSVRRKIGLHLLLFFSPLILPARFRLAVGVLWDQSRAGR